MFGRSAGSSVDLTGPVGDRSVPLDIGPFADQSDLLHFAMLLETVPGMGHIDLIDPDLETALFVVRAPTPAAVAAATMRVPDYRVKAEVTGNAVSARIEEDKTRAVALLARGGTGVLVGGGALYAARNGALWWRWAAHVAAVGTAAAAVVFFAVTGNEPAPEPVALRPSPTAVTPTGALPTPTVRPPVVAPSVPLTTATPQPAASPSPVRTPSPGPSATPTPRPTTTPTPAVAQRYRGSFSSSLGSVSAVNGCQWDTPFTGDLDVSLTRAADGTLRGDANLSGKISYVVTNVPPGAICNPSAVSLDGTGSANGNGSQVNASLSGSRDLALTFSGTVQGNNLVGSVSMERSLSTVSTFGNTTETRSAAVSGVTLSR